MLRARRWNFDEEQDINIVSKVPSCKMLIKYKGEKSNNIGKILHNQVCKININTNETNKNLVSSDRVQ